MAEVLEGSMLVELIRSVEGLCLRDFAEVSKEGSRLVELIRSVEGSRMEGLKKKDQGS